MSTFFVTAMTQFIVPLNWSISEYKEDWPVNHVFEPVEFAGDPKRIGVVWYTNSPGNGSAIIVPASISCESN